MSSAWSVSLPDSEKLVLLALADCANDEGRCWPSMRSLVDKCSKTDRTIQAAIKSLVEKGHLTRDEKPGKGCLYLVHPKADTPEAASPRRDFPPKGTTQTPEAVSDKPSRTITTSEAKASSVNARPSDFQSFWEAYPRKVGRLAAEKAWRRAKLPPLADVLAAIARYRRDKPADIDFCHPTTWLNQGRWLDEASVPAGQPPPIDHAAVQARLAADIEARRALAAE